MKIFANYEHDSFEPKVKQIINDLKAQGFEVIDTGNYPESYDIMLLFITQKSMDLSSKCIKAIDKALEDKKKIIPINLETGKMYYRMAAIQHIDFSGNNDYQSKFNELLNNLNK